jgi:hypothetical protein
VKKRGGGKINQISCLGHSNVFICFASFENPKTYQPARKKNKQEKITKSIP